MPLCASAKIAQQSACCVCHGPPQYSRSHCSSSTLVGREIVARQARIVRCCAHPIADIKAKPYHSIFCSHLQGVPNSPVACADTSLVMATRSGIMASLKLGGVSCEGDVWPTQYLLPSSLPHPRGFPHVSLLSHQAAQNGTLEQVTSSLSAYHTDFSTHSAFHKQRLLLHGICPSILGRAVTSLGKGISVQSLPSAHRIHRWSACPAIATMALAAGPIATPKAHNACTHSSSRAEPATQVSPHWHRASQDISS